MPSTAPKNAARGRAVSEKEVARTRIAHIADSHLLDRHLDHSSRAEAFRDGLRNALQAAVAAGAKAVLHGGDLLDSPRPSPANLTFLLEIHQQFIDLQIPIYVVDGNHDAAVPSWMSLMRPLHDQFGFQMINWKTTTIPGTDLVVMGVPWCSKEEFIEKTKDADVDIILMHAFVKEFISFQKEMGLSVTDFPARPALFALGDIHVTDVRRIGDQVVAYPGSTELKSRSEDEQKNVVVYNFAANVGNGKKVASYEIVPFPTQPVLRLSVATEEDLEKVLIKLQAPEASRAIVFLKFNPRLADVMQRIKTALQEGTVFRPIPDSLWAESLMPDVDLDDVSANVKPRELLPKYFPTDSPLLALAYDLCNEDLEKGGVRPELLVESYTEKRFKELEPNDSQSPQVI